MESLDFVAIVDDEESSALLSQYHVEDLGYTTQLITKGHYDSVEQLTDEILQISYNIAVLCDHRLTYGGLANFYGSALVAQLYKKNIPAILLTQFSSIDVDTTIRQFRRWMPVMMARDELNIESISASLQLCLNELRGNIPPSRIPHRTLIEIKETYCDGDEWVAEAFIPGWKPDHAVRFPLSLMNEVDRNFTINKTRNEKQPVFFFAEVNIGANTQAELFFDNFERVEEPSNSPLDNWTSLLSK